MAGPIRSSFRARLRSEEIPTLLRQASRGEPLSPISETLVDSFSTYATVPRATRYLATTLLISFREHLEKAEFEEADAQFKLSRRIMQAAENAPGGVVQSQTTPADP